MTVPNTPVALNTVWTPAQWNAAWAYVDSAIAAAISPLAPLTSPGLLGNPTAPTPAPGDNDTSIATSAFVVASGPALNVGRNKIHNPQFRIQQRSAGPFTTVGYTLDRYVLNLTTDAASVTPSTLTDTDRAGIGDEEAENGLQNVFTGNAAAGAFNQIQQRIEDIYRLSGKTVTVSFWAKAASGTPKLGVSVDQNFGSGGSTTVTGNGTAVTLATTWARYSVTLAIASASGKTVGAGNFTQLNLWYSSGATNATRAGSVGVQSGTVNIWGLQLEIGSVATPFEKQDPRYDLTNCQRFFQAGSINWAGSSGASATYNLTSTLPVQMRASPTNTFASTASTNVSSLSLTTLNADAIIHQFTVGATLAWVSNYNYTVSADL